MVATLDTLNIESHIMPLNTLHVEFDRNRDECKSRRQTDQHTRIVMPDGRKLEVSDRFWTSFSSLHSLGRSVFDYFSHAEVFDRLTQVKGDPVRLTFEGSGRPAADGRLLSCTQPTKPILQVSQVRRLVDKFGGTDPSYAQGVVTARFDCPFPLDFNVAGDGFRTQFQMSMPIDGFGLPAAYLALLRLICANGLVGVAPAFKTVFQLSRGESDLTAVLDRAMDTFNNEEGFHSFKLRVEAAAKSWGSLAEAIALRKALNRSLVTEGWQPDRQAQLLGKYDELCGNPLKYYGLTAIEELSVRKARSIPVEATVYDLLNFASEVSTHHVDRRDCRDRIGGWIGQTISQEFDLEGTIDSFPQFKDYFLARKGPDAAPATSPTAPSEPTPDAPPQVS